MEYGVAFALALSGDSSRSEALVNDLERRFPEDTAARFSYLPVVRARFALNRAQPAKAIELLQVTVPYELGEPQSFIGSFGTFCAVYVRGEAYLAAHKGVEAAVEFQKILDLVESGDEPRAKIAFEEFLTLWRDADPDIPIFKQAKAEYARLQ